MTQSSCKRDTKFKIHPGMKLALVRVFSCKHPLIQPTARSCRGLSWPRSFGMGFRVLAAAYLGGESVCINALKRCSRLAEPWTIAALFSVALRTDSSLRLKRPPHITDPSFAFYSKALFARLPSVESKHCFLRVFLSGYDKRQALQLGRMWEGLKEKLVWVTK